jgi:DNA helicase HerA-like ATPase
MKNTLHLATSLNVPAAIAARTVFIAGTKGSGKTYSAGVMAEEMLSAGIHLVILDPLGAWFGLRSDAKGGPGGYPIVILGGEHADAPLLPTSGEIVADYIVKSGQSVILDMSGFSSNAEQDGRRMPNSLPAPVTACRFCWRHWRRQRRISKGCLV